MPTARVDVSASVTAVEPLVVPLLALVTSVGAPMLPEMVRVGDDTPFPSPSISASISGVAKRQLAMDIVYLSPDRTMELSDGQASKFIAAVKADAVSVGRYIRPALLKAVAMVVTAAVLNAGIVCRHLQLPNAPLKVVTFAVSNSGTVCRAEQLLNVDAKLVTFDVLNSGTV